MRGRDSSVAPPPEGALGPGDLVGGFQIARVLAPSDGRWMLADATLAGGEHVTLRVSSRAAATNPGQQERVARLQRLRAVEELPMVGLVAAGLVEGRLVVAYEQPTGRTLAERLAEGPLQRDDAVRLLSQVAGALETLHAFGLPHAVPAPDRILLTPRRPGAALLTDYGFGPSADRAGTSDALMSIVDYLAPEAAQGHPVEPASTVYALACVLVECLTGAPPYPYDRPLLVLQAHLTEDPPRVSERADLPRDLDRVIATALHHRPEHRQRTPGGLLRATQRALGQTRYPIPIVQPAKERAAAGSAAAAAPAIARRPARTAAPAATSTPAPRRPARKGGPEAAAARPLAAAARRSAARERARRRPSLPTLPSPHLRWPTRVAVGAGALLLVAGTAGFATASLRPATSPDRATTPGSAAQSAAPASTATARTRYVRSVDATVRRLSAQRTIDRRRLRHARHARAQAGAAAALASAYRDARRALPPAPTGVAAADGVTRRLAATQKAYTSLASAARHADAAAFRTAGRTVVAQERGLADALAALGAELRAHPA